MHCFTPFDTIVAIDMKPSVSYQEGAGTGGPPNQSGKSESYRVP